MSHSLLSRSLPLSDQSSDHYPLLHSGRIRGDNYGYFLQTGFGKVLAVDVPDGRRMLQLLGHKNWTLTAVLLTHTHADHVVDLERLLAESGCAFYHPEGAEVPVTGIPLADGEQVDLNGLRFRALDTSGHSPLDFSYWFEDLNLLFCGDTLFASGCGRMFAGPPEKFWNSLLRIRSLPDETRICCGHDYGEDNLLFARKTFPALPRLFDRGINTGMPLSLKEQRRVNPFLRADDPEVASALGQKGEDPVTVFKILRERRNQL